MKDREHDENPAGARSARCDELQRLLLESHDPGEPLPASQQEHLRRCPSCSSFRDDLLTLDDLTREQAPELPEGFQLSLRRRLTEQAQTSAGAKEDTEEEAPAPRRRVMLAAAAVALVAAGALLAARWLGGEEARPTYHRLELSIRADRSYDEVLFDVALPEGVRLLPATGAIIGRGRNLRWRSPIRPGKNGFDLPLAAHAAAGTVKVTLRAGTRVWRGSVPLGAARAERGARDPRALRLAWALNVRTTTGGPR